MAAKKEPVTVGGRMKVLPDYDFNSAPQPKLIVIPAMDFRAEPQQMFDWIRTASKATDVTMSVCNGAFVLAKTGLLDGKTATCHHGGFFSFAAMYPEVHLKRDARFVEQGNLASAGGISSGIDLALRVVGRYAGHDRAVQVADGMEYQGKGWLDPNSNEAYAKMPEVTDHIRFARSVWAMPRNPSARSIRAKRSTSARTDAKKPSKSTQMFTIASLPRIPPTYLNPSSEPVWVLASWTTFSL